MIKRLFYLLSLLPLGISSCNSQSAPASYTDLDVAAFKAKMAEPGVVLLDVRTPEETAKGNIADCAEVDFNANGFEAKIDQLDKDKTYLVYCRSGGRSSQACKLMAKKGFKNLYNLKGGYLAWTGR